MSSSIKCINVTEYILCYTLCCINFRKHLCSPFIKNFAKLYSVNGPQSNSEYEIPYKLLCKYILPAVNITYYKSLSYNSSFDYTPNECEDAFQDDIKYSYFQYRIEM